MSWSALVDYDGFRCNECGLVVPTEQWLPGKRVAEMLDGSVLAQPTCLGCEAIAKARALFTRSGCECGSDKARVPTHSSWCPKAI